MAFPCKIANPFINLDLHDGLFVIFAPPFLIPGKAMHAGAGCLITARVMGDNKENNRKILADGLEVVSQGHCVEKIILPHLNLFPFLPVNINTLIPLLLFGAESKCIFASLTVKGPDGPIAVTPLYIVGFNQTCNDPCCLPTSTLVNWGTVDIGFTMADFQAGLMSLAFDAMIELAFEFGPAALGKLIPKGLKKQQAIVFKKFKKYGAVQLKKMRKQLDLLGKKFGKQLKQGLDISNKAKKSVTSWVKNKSERLISNQRKLLKAGTTSIAMCIENASGNIKRIGSKAIKKSVSLSQKGKKLLKNVIQKTYMKRSRSTTSANMGAILVKKKWRRSKNVSLPANGTNVKWSKTKQQLDDMYIMAENAKDQIDALADKIANETGGRVAKAPLKNRERALEKAIQDYGGDATKVKDIARNTIVVEQDQFKNATSLIRNQGAKIKTHDAASNPLGYSGSNAVIMTQAGIPAEIQINTPEMIYAKESPEIAKVILGDEKYADLTSKLGLPGGRGHSLYEDYRSLPDGDSRASKIAAESCEYYNSIREKIKKIRE